MGDYILLNEVETEKILSILKRTKFEEFKVHKHFYKNGKPRHGVSLGKAKEIYSQFNKIKEMSISNHSGEKGYKYTITYQMNKKSSYSLCLFLDSEPKEIFNAIHYGQNIDKRVMKRYFGFSK